MSVEEIKADTASAPTLFNLDLEKDFILYTVGGESRISIGLAQTDDKNEEQPIAFFSEGHKEYEESITMWKRRPL